jgi:hypothetical protein
VALKVPKKNSAHSGDVFNRLPRDRAFRSVFFRQTETQKAISPLNSQVAFALSTSLSLKSLSSRRNFFYY